MPPPDPTTAATKTLGPGAAKELIFSNACPRDSIPLTFLEISDKEACERVLSDLDAVLIASDSDVPVKPGVLNTVMPEGPDEKSKVMRGCHAATGNRARVRTYACACGRC